MQMQPGSNMQPGTETGMQVEQIAVDAAGNVYIADGPDYQGRRLTSYPRDEGQELTNLAFAPESSQPLRVGSDFGRKDFDGHAIAEQDVSRTIDGAHPAFTQQRLHLILSVEHSVDD